MFRDVHVRESPNPMAQRGVGLRAAASITTKLEPLPRPVLISVRLSNNVMNAMRVELAWKDFACLFCVLPRPEQGEGG